MSSVCQMSALEVFYSSTLSKYGDVKQRLGAFCFCFALIQQQRNRVASKTKAPDITVVENDFYFPILNLKDILVNYCRKKDIAQRGWGNGEICLGTF